MKTCLGSLLLIVVIAVVVLTAVYHTSVNGELKFELRDSDTEYINTQRSYRPPTPKQNKPAAPAANKAAAPEMQDDMVAEEVEQ